MTRFGSALCPFFFERNCSIISCDIRHSVQDTKGRGSGSRFLSIEATKASNEGITALLLFIPAQNPLLLHHIILYHICIILNIESISFYCGNSFCLHHCPYTRQPSSAAGSFSSLPTLHCIWTGWKGCKIPSTPLWEVNFSFWEIVVHQHHFLCQLLVLL